MGQSAGRPKRLAAFERAVNARNAELLDQRSAQPPPPCPCMGPRNLDGGAANAVCHAQTGEQVHRRRPFAEQRLVASFGRAVHLVGLDDSEPVQIAASPRLQQRTARFAKNPLCSSLSSSISAQKSFRCEVLTGDQPEGAPVRRTFSREFGQRGAVDAHRLWFLRCRFERRLLLLPLRYCSATCSITACVPSTRGSEVHWFCGLFPQPLLAASRVCRSLAATVFPWLARLCLALLGSGRIGHGRRGLH